MTLDMIGVLPKKEKQFEKVGIVSIETLLKYFPTDYRDYSKSILPGDLYRYDGQYVMTVGKIVSAKVIQGQHALCTLQGGDGEYFSVMWFNQAYRVQRLDRGHAHVVAGLCKWNPDYRSATFVVPEIFESAKDVQAGIYPIYKKIPGMADDYLRSAIDEALLWLDACVIDYTSEPERRALGVESAAQTVRMAHHPESQEDVKRVKQRIVVDELFPFCMGLDEKAYGTFIEGFEEQLLGHKSGETFDVSIEYPDDAGTAKDVDGNEVDLSGKSVLFSVTVKSVMEYELTDEAIVKAFGDTTTMPDGTPVTTVDQLYDYYIESETMTNTQNAIIAYLQENSEVSEIPESIVEQQKEVERQYAEYIASVYNYESVDEFLAANDYEDMDAYIDTAMDSIESNVKYRLIIQAIAEADGLEVENDAYVKAFGATKDIVAATYGEEYAAQMALEYTVLTHLMSTAKVS